MQLLTCKSVECVFVWLSHNHGFDLPCGSHQLPVFLKYSTSEVARVTRTSAAWHKPFMTANNNLFKIIKFTLTSCVEFSAVNRRRPSRETPLGPGAKDGCFCRLLVTRH